MARLFRRRPAPPVPEVAPVPATFLDPEAEARFREVGHVVVDLLDADELARVRDAHEHHHPAASTTWDSDFYDPSPEVKAEVASVVETAFAAGLRRHLVDHRPILSNFVVNWPGPDGGLPIHHHTSVVDESRFRSVVVWCAVNDGTEANGTLHVVERSHRVPRGPWGEGRPHWFESRRDQMMASQLTSVEVRAGQALMFDNALLHCSLPNVSDGPRRSAVAIVVPNEAPLRYYQWDPSGFTRAYELDPSFFIGNASPYGAWADPSSLPYLGDVPADGSVATETEIDALLRPGTCSHQVSSVAYTSHP